MPYGNANDVVLEMVERPYLGFALKIPQIYPQSTWVN